MPTDPAAAHPSDRRVRRARATDLPLIATTLGRAFHDDPVWRYAIRRHDRFEERIGTIMGVVARLHMADSDTVWVAADGGAAAVWAPPGRWHLPPRRFATSAPALLRSAGLRSVPHLRILSEMERRHPRRPEHWYLAILGTEPAAQGRGLGSAVMAPALARCDREVVGAYLESSKAENLPFYERHGFRLVDTIDLGRGAPPIFTMWRDPRPEG